MKSIITPDWPAPRSIAAFTTTRHGGCSEGAYASFNLALHVEDDPDCVKANRAELKKNIPLPTEPLWLKQIHSTDVIKITQQSPQDITADGSWTQEANTICAIFTADCLPVLLCDQKGSCVAALHAGWRGLASGILETGVQQLPADPKDLLAWLGPAISQEHYEVGEEVRQAFIAYDPQAQHAFKPSERKDHWYIDIYFLARQRLQSVGVHAIYGGDHCTYRESDQFYSFRRDKETGRMASLIWIKP